MQVAFYTWEKIAKIIRVSEGAIQAHKVDSIWRIPPNEELKIVKDARLLEVA